MYLYKKYTFLNLVDGFIAIMSCPVSMLNIRKVAVVNIDILHTYTGQFKRNITKEVIEELM